MEDSRRADWSELYPEILSLIAGHLQTQLDAHNFRSVCKNWSYSLSSQIPKTLPIVSSGHPQTLNPVVPNSSFQITANAVYLLRSRKFPESEPFLITVEEFEKEGIV
ncbi:putative F-box/kelch-repeat protein At5g24040 [Spinacia oleracea]|uniref:F-box/kelch-repeat protein At5g24040 n=1 Tax=Spinacia oleracea TaxID=3562 RepID=A0ABM3QM04_SPIOL|nr:putative F-box/kelch-repeat protein At5g24040 [Spinacia oleracea]